jgi:hypothetical protein
MFIVTSCRRSPVARQGGNQQAFLPRINKVTEHGLRDAYWRDTELDGLDSGRRPYGHSSRVATRR